MNEIICQKQQICTSLTPSKFTKKIHKLSNGSFILEDGIIQNEILFQCMLHTQRI